MSDGRIEQIGTPSADLQLPGDRVRGVVRGHAQPGQRRASSTPSTGRLSIDGQEIRASKVTTNASNDGRVTLALRPEGIALGEGDPGSNRLTGTVEDINFLGSIVRIRVRLGEDKGGEPPSIVALDTFNEPHLRVPDVGQPVTISFPPEASFVLGAARDEAAIPSSEVGAEV